MIIYFYPSPPSSLVVTGVRLLDTHLQLDVDVTTGIEGLNRDLFAFCLSEVVDLQSVGTIVTSVGEHLRGGLLSYVVNTERRVFQVPPYGTIFEPFYFDFTRAFSLSLDGTFRP